MIVNRRNFLGSMLAAGSVGLLAPRGGRAAESTIEILINEPIGKILPDIYSHFIEHLGGVIYDGIWVGEKSRVPNIIHVASSRVMKRSMLIAADSWYIGFNLHPLPDCN